jgi:hypothetical protein
MTTINTNVSGNTSAIQMGVTKTFENMQDAGKVTVVRPEKGYGFAEFNLNNGVKARAFFHVSQLGNSMNHHGFPQTADRLVGSKIVLTPRGWVVTKVRLIHRPSNLNKDI